MTTDTRPIAELLAEYDAWASGELSEISDEAMSAGRTHPMRFSLTYSHRTLGSNRAWFRTEGEAREAANRWRDNPLMTAIGPIVKEVTTA